MLKANFHTHTTFCDGSDSPEAVAKYAFTGGMSHLGFSGHMDADIHMDWPSYVKEIRRLKDLYVGRMDILLGVELDTLYDPGSICGEDGLPEAEYIIGSTHFLQVLQRIQCNVNDFVFIFMNYQSGRLPFAFSDICTTGDRFHGSLILAHFHSV